MAQHPTPDSSPLRSLPGVAGIVTRFAIVTWVLVRVAAVTVLALAVFAVAFLGYFTLPFIFVVLGLLAWLFSRSRGWRDRLRVWIGRRRTRHNGEA